MIRSQQELINRALDLVGKTVPEFNLAPTIELVRQAWSMGYELVPMRGPIFVDDGSAQSTQAPDAQAMQNIARGER